MFYISWRIILLVIGFMIFIIVYWIRKTRRNKLIKHLDQQKIYYDQILTAPGNGLNLIIDKKHRLIHFYQVVADSYKSRTFEWDKIEQIRMLENQVPILNLLTEQNKINEFELRAKAKADTTLMVEFKIHGIDNVYLFKFGKIPHSTLERVKYLEMAVELKEWLKVCSELLLN